jgi:hypothetical protein
MEIGYPFTPLWINTNAEQIIGKLNALVGRMDGDANFKVTRHLVSTKCLTLAIPFTPVKKMIDCCAALRRSGFSSSGREQLYSGISGEPLDGLAFIGCVQYQRLRHMVIDKGLFGWVVSPWHAIHPHTHTVPLIPISSMLAH